MSLLYTTQYKLQKGALNVQHQATILSDEEFFLDEEFLLKESQ